MMRTRRRAVLVGLLLASVAFGFGCNMLSVPYFLMQPEPKEKAALKEVAAKDKDQEVIVVVLVSGGLETRPEFFRADRDLGFRIAKRLQELCKNNEENVKVVSPAKVEEFKNEHPGWRTMDTDEIARRFAADYVINVEVEKLSMYQPGTNNLLYRGDAQLSVTLVDAANPTVPEEAPVQVIYPDESRGGAIPIDDEPPQKFKNDFFEKIATQVAWQFTAHPTSDSYTCE
jgi:hypothetical protein